MLTAVVRAVNAHAPVAPGCPVGSELVATVAYNLPRALGATATSICDSRCGKPSVSARQCSPPSVDLYSPPFGPLYIFLSSHGPERASQNPAYTVCASKGSIRTKAAAGVLASIQQADPGCAAIHGSVDAALRTRSEGVPKNRRVDTVCIMGVYRDARNLLRIIEPHMRPGLAGIG